MGGGGIWKLTIVDGPILSSLIWLSHTSHSTGPANQPASQHTVTSCSNNPSGHELMSTMLAKKQQV